MFFKIPNREYNHSPVFEAMRLFHRNFQGLLMNLSSIKPEILISKTPLVIEKLLYVWWDIYF